MSNDLANYKVCERAIKLKKDIEFNFLELGALLYNIRTENAYLPAWETFDLFLTEIEISKSLASKLISIYYRFVVGYKIANGELLEAGGYTKLYAILPLINTHEDAIEWLEKSKVLSLTDIKKEVREAQGGVSMKMCKHDTTYKLEVCDDCGESWRI